MKGGDLDIHKEVTFLGLIEGESAGQGNEKCYYLIYS